MVIMIGRVSLSTESIDPWVCERASPPLQVGCQLVLGREGRQPAAASITRASNLTLVMTSGATYASIMMQLICASASRWHSRRPRWGRMQSSGVTC
jgi:hypothetical protein